MNTQSFIAGFFWGWFATSAAVLGALIYRRMTTAKDGVKVVPPGALTAQEYIAKVEADPKRAEALQRARERNAGVGACDGGQPK